MKSAAAVFVYGMADADAAYAASAALDSPLTVWMREDTAAGYGAAVTGRIFAIARAAHPSAAVRAAVDCGDAPGLALALLRRGVDRVSLTGPDAMLTRVAAIAAGYGAALAPVPPDALDLLGVDNPKKACASLLARFHNGGRSPHGE